MGDTAMATDTDTVDTAATTEDTAATLTATEDTAGTTARLQPKPTTLCVQRESLTNVESHKNKDVKNQKQVLKINLWRCQKKKKRLKKKFLGFKKKKKKKKKK